MLKLPTSTEVRKNLPKASLYKQFEWTNAWKTAFDADVVRLDIVNNISPATVPAIAKGAEVDAIFVIEVQLRAKAFNSENILHIAKAMPHHILWVLSYEGDACLAVYQDRLFTTSWQSAENISISLGGLNLDNAWSNMVCEIGNFTIKQGNTLTVQIEANERSEKIERQISALERQMRASKQPHRQRELFKQIKKLKEEL